MNEEWKILKDIDGNNAVYRSELELYYCQNGEDIYFGYSNGCEFIAMPILATIYNNNVAPYNSSFDGKLYDDLSNLILSYMYSDEMEW